MAMAENKKEIFFLWRSTYAASSHTSQIRMISLAFQHPLRIEIVGGN